jgi:alcohol dehydrogenase (cytochrome c)
LPPQEGDWPTYNGTLDGNRNSRLDQVNLEQRGKAATAMDLLDSLQWPGDDAGGCGWSDVCDGEQSGLCAERQNRARDLAIRAAQERRRTISSDAAIGVNRGVAVLGDRVFYLTDDAHLIALHRLTGALLWDVDTPEGAKGLYGGTAAPLVVGDLVITGVSGGDNGIRGFVAAYKAATGELAWKL